MLGLGASSPVSPTARPTKKPVAANKRPREHTSTLETLLTLAIKGSVLCNLACARRTQKPRASSSSFRRTAIAPTTLSCTRHAPRRRFPQRFVFRRAVWRQSTNAKEAVIAEIEASSSASRACVVVPMGIAAVMECAHCVFNVDAFILQSTDVQAWVQRSDVRQAFKTGAGKVCFRSTCGSPTDDADSQRGAHGSHDSVRRTVERMENHTGSPSRSFQHGMTQRK
jgi:hypothetical protein